MDFASIKYSFERMCSHSSLDCSLSMARSRGRCNASDSFILWTRAQIIILARSLYIVCCILFLPWLRMSLPLFIAFKPINYACRVESVKNACEIGRTKGIVINTIFCIVQFFTLKEPMQKPRALKYRAQMRFLQRWVVFTSTSFVSFCIKLRRTRISKQTFVCSWQKKHSSIDS